MIVTIVKIPSRHSFHSCLLIIACVNLKMRLPQIIRMVEPEVVKERGLDRILDLSDDVFAFALTLLVLDLVVPVFVSNQDTSVLPSLLAGEWNGFFNYFLSFIMIALWWNIHHYYFEYIRGYDRRLKALNLLILLTITLIPFFTKLLDTWSSLSSPSLSSPFATALYAFDQGAAGTFLALTWRYATEDRRLIDRRLDQRTVNRMRTTSIIPPTMFYLSIPLGYIGAEVAWASWLATFPISYIVRRKYGK
jgi:uncharacterized membrane protein